MAELEVVIDVPKGSFIKRDDEGKVDYVSPFPCPFNYGSVPNTLSGDGDRLDALVLGPRLERGSRVRVTVRATVDFIDAGDKDPKLVCSQQPLTAADRKVVERFFTAFAFLKGKLNLVCGKRGPTAYRGLDESALI